MTDVYTPCLCGSGKKFKFCCYEIQKRGEVIPATSECCKFPIYECKVLKNWKTAGISPVHVSRELTKDSYAFVSYLVDFWCLGVKDTTLKFGISKADLKHIYNKSDELETVSYQDARSLILGANDFAKALDIVPHSSWNGMPSSFIEAHLAYEKKFSFGQNGKPFYFSGPYDHERYDVEKIINKISKAKGHYTVLV
ncbi:MAG: SEC-C domain-containing protein [Parachlamydiaceae bacterium]|nr:SEC-C domain-containing protein [Parachlamydiaceae bacterium]